MTVGFYLRGRMGHRVRELQTCVSSIDTHVLGCRTSRSVLQRSYDRPFACVACAQQDRIALPEKALHDDAQLTRLAEFGAYCSGAVTADGCGNV